MRLIYFFLAILSLCGIYSCKKETTAPNVLILGKWNFTKWSEVSYYNGVKELDTTATPSQYMISYRQFSQDGTYVDSGNVPSQQYSVAGSTLQIYAYNDTAYRFTLNCYFPMIIGYNVTSNYGGPIKIIRITSKQMELQQEFDYTVVNPSPAYTITRKQLVTEDYTKEWC